ncbi:MAG: hypothetical protein ACP6IU_13065 [Candidatus Asgardarchaeia archaeon]
MPIEQHYMELHKILTALEQLYDNLKDDLQYKELSGQLTFTTQLHNLLKFIRQIIEQIDERLLADGYYDWLQDLHINTEAMMD